MRVKRSVRHSFGNKGTGNFNRRGPKVETSAESFSLEKVQEGREKKTVDQ